MFATNFKYQTKKKLTEKRERLAAVEKQDRLERAKCRQRSGGRCEVIESRLIWGIPGAERERSARRCARRASQNHHLIGGSGRRNKGKSILAAHRIDTCDRCHDDITGHVLVPVDGTQKEDAATVQYERHK